MRWLVHRTGGKAYDCLANKILGTGTCHRSLVARRGTIPVSSAYKIYDEAVEALIEFVPYAYANTRPVYSKIDDLRDLVVRYVIWNLGDLGGHRQFKKLLHNGGDFVTDSWQLTWHRTHEWMS